MATANIWQARYRVFISYSHADEETAKYLEERMEAWQTPKKLIGSWTPNGPIPKDLKPVFRDRSSLAAEADLTAALQERLENSATMVVICSPNACRQRAEGERNWIDEEIRHYRNKGGAGRIFAYIIDGTPKSGGDTECFPPALLEIEPAAADARPDKDTREGAFIKLLAGILGCDPTDLAEKENQALRDRARNARFIAAGMAGLALLAVGMAAWGFERAYRAERNLTLAREAVNTVTAMLDDDELGAETGFAPHAGTISQALIPFYESFTRAAGGSEATRVDMAKAQTTLGRMLSRQGELGEAVEHYRSALQQLDRAAARRNPSDDVRAAYMDAAGYLMSALIDEGDLNGARAVLEHADQIHVGATLQDSTRVRLASNLLSSQRARLSRFGQDYAASLRVTEETVRLARANVEDDRANITARRDLFLALSDLAFDYRKLEREDEAVRTDTEGCTIAAETARLAPRNIYAQSDRLFCDQDAAKRLVDAGNFESAMAIYRSVESELKGLIDANPSVARLQIRLAGLYQDIAALEQWRGNYAGLLSNATAAIDEWAEVLSSARSVPSSPGSLWDSYQLLKGGLDEVYKDDINARLQGYQRFVARFRDLPDRFPRTAVFLQTVGDARYTVADLRVRAGRDAVIGVAAPAELAEEFSVSSQLLERARAAGFYGSEPNLAVTLCISHTSAAKQYLAINNLARANEEIDAQLAYCRPRWEQERWDFYLMQAVLGAWRTQGDIRRAERRGQDARTAYLAAEGLVRGSAAENLITLYSDGFALPANPAEVARWRALRERGTGKRFTVPVTAPGSNNRTPFQIYVFDWGPDYPYEGIEGQAMWLERRNGLIVPTDVRESFVRLHRIAKENNVSFPELAAYALGMAQQNPSPPPTTRRR